MDGLQWHNIHIIFHENQSTSSNKDTHVRTVICIYLIKYYVQIHPIHQP
jgi:hypothetical protein